MSDRSGKGSSLIKALDDYTVIDIETTGFNPNTDEIIEVAAVRVRDGEVVDSFSSLVYIDYIPSNITSLTGISESMVSDAPYIEEVLDKFRMFIGNDILVGYNVNFDINFLYDNILDYIGEKMSNDFIDVLRIARKVYPELSCHKLCYMIEYLGIKEEQTHRAESDCIQTHKVYSILKEKMGSKSSKRECKDSSGETRLMNCGLMATIIEYNSYNDITVKFEDGLIRRHVRKDKFMEGKIAHKLV